MFSLDKLKVYDKALANAASLAQRSRSWDKRHAVTDQLLRASESFVLNLAEGARLRSAAKRQHVLDYAIGSALECAACLDIAQIKEFLCPDETLHAVVSRLARSAQTLDAPVTPGGSCRHESGVEHCRSQRALCVWREAESVRDSRKRGGPGRNVWGALHAHGQA
jgi:four helix bundle protein